jgi:hypothetical protein
MSKIKSLLALAAAAVPAVACSASPGDGVGTEALRSADTSSQCATAADGSDSVVLVWSPGDGTVDPTVTFHKRSAFSYGPYDTFAAVDSKGNVDYIVWVLGTDEDAFGAANEVCEAIPVFPGSPAPGSPLPDPESMTHGKRDCNPEVPPPVSTPCVTVSEASTIGGGTLCSSPAWTAPMCTSDPVSIQGLGGNCLDVQYANPTSPVVDDYVCGAGNLAESFTFQNDGTIRNYWGYCLDVLYGDAAAGILDFTSCNGTGSQVWTRQGTAQIVGLGGNCLDVLYGNPNPSTTVDLATCNGTGSQNWTFSAE